MTLEKLEMNSECSNEYFFKFMKKGRKTTTQAEYKKEFDTEWRVSYLCNIWTTLSREYKNIRKGLIQNEELAAYVIFE